MRTIDSFFSSQYIQVIGWTLLHSLWQSVLLAGFLAFALLVLRRHSANLRYLAAIIVLVMAFCLLPATFLLLARPVLYTSSELPMVDNEAIKSGNHRQLTTKTDQQLEILPNLTAQSSVSELPNQFQRWAEDRFSPLIPWFVVIWLLGVCYSSIRLIIQWKIVIRLK
ncbi:MAG: hypothetical protein AB1489_35665, partial [Acidobacteriota bacterium]